MKLSKLLCALVLVASAVVANAQPPGVPTSFATFGGEGKILQAGWSLIGNPMAESIPVAGYFGSADNRVGGVTYAINSIWKWKFGTWYFFSPQLSINENITYANSHGLGLLDYIYPGEAFWIDSQMAMVLPQIVAEEYSWTFYDLAGFGPGWHMMAVPRPMTMREINRKLALRPLPNDVVPTEYAESFWAWDDYNQRWEFYAPWVELSCGYDYYCQQGFADSFGGQWKAWEILRQGKGFWTNSLLLDYGKG